MSIVNQMLKELERRAKAPLNPEVALSGLLSPDSARYVQHKKKLPVILFFGCLLLLMFFFFNHLKHFNSPREMLEHITLSPAMLKDELPSASNTDSEKEILPIPAILTGIQLTNDDETTSIRFLLNREARYTISSDRNNMELILTLDHTNMISDMAPVDYLKSAIQGMEVTNDDNGNLKITLTLNPNVELSYLNLLNGMKSPELQLKLTRNKNQTNIDKKNNIVPSPLESPDQRAAFSVKKTDEFNAKEQYENALKLSSAGENKSAIVLLTNLLAQYPYFSEARGSLIELLLQSGKRTKADEFLQEGLLEKPNDPILIQIKARLLLNEGNAKKALELLQVAIPPIQGYPEYHAFMAALYQQLGQAVIAERIYSQLIQLYPNQAVWWVGYGIALESNGENDKAKQVYLHATEMSGLTPTLRDYLNSKISSA